MGLMDKIGSKLGSKDTDSTTTDSVNEYPHTSDVGHTKSSDYNNLNSGMSNLSTGTGSTGLGHSGSPTTGSSALGNSGLNSSGLGHSTSSSRNQMPGGFGGNDSQLYGSGTHGSNSTGYSTQDRAGESIRDKVHPHTSLDPYSTKGQNAAYDATPSAIPIAGGREVGNPTHESSHLGRDGALAGGAGAAGVGAYETSKHGHHNGRSSIDHNNNEHDGKKSGIAGIFSSSKDKTHDDKHHTGRDTGVAGTAAYEAEKHGHHNGRSSIDNNSSQHHYGRDAGIAGGVGAAGYEAEKHRHGNQSQSGNHLGRDTGIVGSGYESEKHGHGHHNNGRSSFDNNSNNNNNNNNYNEHDGKKGGLAGIFSSSKDKDNSRDDKHHYGRDAGVAGGVGAAGYEAEKHHHNNGQQHSGSHLGHNNNNQQSGGLLSHSNSNTRGESGNHYGRDAGVAGGVGTAAYEAAKHHDHSHSSTPYDSTSGQSYGSSGQSYGNNTSSSHLGHHNNHQSGLGAGLSGGNSQNRGVSPGGMSIAKKLSAAYEAGYRDAMAHAEAEGHKSHHY